jgi:spermidine synthase
VIPWELVDTASIPDAEGELRLMRRGAEYSIMAGSIELMNSRLSGSEEALAKLAAERLDHVANPHVLIGGYGMGFTLRAALCQLGQAAKVTVAELIPAVIDWARGPMAHLCDGCLDDPRVRLHLGDVGGLIGRVTGAYDAILLDVDNGPEGLSRAANDGLYDAAGLGAARRALRPRGVLAVWSSTPNRAFTERLKRAGFKVEETPVRARAGRGARHVIWLATARAA